MYCILFEKKQNLTINSETDIDEIFIALFSSEEKAKQWVDRNGMTDDQVIYRNCLLLQ